MLAITTDSLRGYDLSHAFAIAKAAGLDGIEVTVSAALYDTHDADYLNALQKTHDLPIVALAAPENISQSKAEKTVDLAEAVGAKMVTLTPPDLFDFHYKSWLQDEMLQLRKKKKIHIALVNAPATLVLGILPKYALNDIQNLKEFPDIALDTSNAASKHEQLLEVYAALKTNISHIYLSNARGEHDHLLLPDGNLPLESLITRLGRDKFDKAVVLKFNPAAVGLGSTEKVIENLVRCREYVEKYWQVA